MTTSTGSMPTSGKDERRREHPVADAIAACIKAGREGDEKTLKNARNWVKLLMGGGFGMWVAVAAVQDWRSQAKNNREDNLKAQTALIQAVKEETTAIDNLVWTMWETQTNSHNEHTAIMQRLGVKPPPTITRPSSEKPVKAVPTQSSYGG